MSSALVYRQGGFTLLEVLVALALFSLLSLMTFTSLRAMIDARQQTGAASERLAAVQMALARLALDIEQARPRGIRDEYGHHQPAMIYDVTPDAGLEFTRGGRQHSTPGGGGGGQQRLRYLFEEGQLIRESWPVLDRGPGLETFRQPVLGEVEAFELRFLDGQGEWHDHWPPGCCGFPVGQYQADFPLPAAVEVWLELSDWGRLRRLLLVQEGFQPPPPPPGESND